MSERVGRSYRLFMDSDEALYDALASTNEDLLHTNITRTYLPFPLYVERMLSRAGEDFWLVQRPGGVRTPLNEQAYQMLTEQVCVPSLHFQRTYGGNVWTLDRFGSTELYLVHLFEAGTCPAWMPELKDITDDPAYQYDVLAGVLSSE